MRYASVLAILLLFLCDACALERVPDACRKTAQWPITHHMEYLSEDPDSTLLGMDVSMTKSRLSLLVEATEVFCQTQGHYPVVLEQLKEAASDGTWPARCADWMYSDGIYLVDAWERPITYRLSDSVPEFLSAGHDGVFGTEDDLRSARLGDPDATPFPKRIPCASRR